MKATERYIHHGHDVAVFSDLKGKHRENCLCWNGCKRFVPENRGHNCPIANALFTLDVTYGVTTPVFECRDYEE